MSSKKRLTVSIEESLIKTLKHISIEEGRTSSDLISDYIKAISKNRNTIKAIQDLIK